MILSNSKTLWIMQITTKLTCSIFMSSYVFFIYFFLFTYIEMSEHSSAIYYQNNKERLQKEFVKDIKVFLKKKKKENKAVNHTKIYHKMKNKSLLSIEKNIIKMRKKLLIIVTRNYCFRKWWLRKIFWEKFFEDLNKKVGNYKNLKVHIKIDNKRNKYLLQKCDLNKKGENCKLKQL